MHVTFATHTFGRRRYSAHTDLIHRRAHQAEKWARGHHTFWAAVALARSIELPEKIVYGTIPPELRDLPQEIALHAMLEVRGIRNPSRFLR